MNTGREAVSLLEEAGVELGPGMSSGEFDSVRGRFGFDFNPDHRSLLAAALSLGEMWPDWRSGADADLRAQMDRLVEGFIWDALNQDPPFWPRSWGARPQQRDDVAAAVRLRLASWPLLVPIYGHRFTPGAPSPSGSPVFSIWQTDAIYYGSNLIEYIRNELNRNERNVLSPRTVEVDYWTRFVESANDPNSV